MTDLDGVLVGGDPAGLAVRLAPRPEERGSLLRGELGEIGGPAPLPGEPVNPDRIMNLNTDIFQS